MQNKYSVEITSGARRTLSRMDAHDSRTILSWLNNKLEGCTDPRLYGKALTGNFAGEWRYRIGDYRVIADIQDDKVIILVLTIGHRREAYTK